MDGNKFILGSQKVANVLNRYFVRKPKIIVENLPKSVIDPMTYYSNNVKKNSITNFSSNLST